MSICFHNPGTLDKRAFTIAGLSAKETDNAIGFFGTGFKYAIAVVLRHGLSIKIVTRDNEYAFYTRRDKFRDKEHEFIFCHDKETGQTIELPFTTHYGAKWELWQAYRELYTNALDEKGGVCEWNGGELPSDVNVIVSGADFDKVFKNHSLYFLDAETIAKTRTMRCVEKVPHSHNTVYYKTMYTGTKLEKEPYFTYDFIATEELTEDRTIRDTWYLRTYITRVWTLGMSAEQLIEHLPKIANDRYFENGLHDTGEDPSEAFVQACTYLTKFHHPLPMWARDVYGKTRPFNEQVETFKLSKYERAQFERAIKVLNHNGYFVDGEAVTFCASLPDDLLGYVKNGAIFIAKEAFERGFQTLLGTLYEEYLHKEKGVEDMTREMQNLLVDRCAKFMEHIYLTEMGQ